MDQINKYSETTKQFCRDSIRFFKKCTKPDRRGTYIYISNSNSHLISLKMNYAKVLS
jgi:preprotein translocase subunit Sss1